MPADRQPDALTDIDAMRVPDRSTFVNALRDATAQHPPSPDVPTTPRVLEVVAAVVSAALSLSAFWPRRFPVLEPSPLRGYLRAEEGFTRLTVLDTLEEFVNEGSLLLRGKGRRLGWALRGLTVAAGFFAVGFVLDAIQG
jgi:hypothetical protein